MVWDPITCTERNGEITGYKVKFHERGGGVVCEETTTNETLTVTELTPYTNYIFQVAGINTNGTGPFIQAVNFTTREDSTYTV